MLLSHYGALFGVITVFGFIVTALLFRMISSIKVDNKKAEHIAELIKNGAMTFLRKEYSILVGVIIIAFALLTFVSNAMVGLSYVGGALFSMLAGYIGMRAATMANVRTTMAAKLHGEYKAFIV